MSGKVYWRAGWYATRLHALSEMGEDERLLSLCGAMVFRSGPPCDWAKRRLSKGVPKCKHCLKLLGESGQSDLDAAWAWFRGGEYELEGLQHTTLEWVCWVAGDFYKAPTRDAAVLAAWRAAKQNNEKGEG